MTVYVSEIEDGTVFIHHSIKYEKSPQTSTRAQLEELKIEILGTRTNTKVVNCFPFLGGKFQTRIECWFDMDTCVIIE